MLALILLHFQMKCLSSQLHSAAGGKWVGKSCPEKVWVYHPWELFKARLDVWMGL